MRILTLTKFYYPFRGGIETVCKNITQENSKSGLPTDVFCSNTTFQNSWDGAGEGRIFRSARLATFRSTSICPFMPWQLRNIVHEYDLIHVHFPDPMTALSLFLIKPDVPFIIHWHSDIIQHRKLMTFFGPLQRWCLEQAQKIIVTSSNYLQGSQDLKPFLRKVEVVPLGISSRNKLILRDPKKIKNILSVGRLTSYKGFDTLIDAALLLPDDYHITIVGDGELRGSLEKRISDLGLQAKVKLLGTVSDEILHELYRDSHVFCLPSHNKAEAFGVVLLEAMSFSLPIVACHIEGSAVPWVNQHHHTGFNVSPLSASELAHGIEQIFNHETNYLDLSKNSYSRFIQEFQLSDMMKRIWRAYGIQ